MKVCTLVVKYGSSFRYLTGKTNNHTPILSDNFCEAKTFMSRIDAMEYAKGMGNFKEELISAGADVESGIYIEEVDMALVNRVVL